MKMSLKKLMFSSAIFLIIWSIAEAREKQIRLEDIEQDNLKSERANNNNGVYLKPPSINAEQTAAYGPPETYDKKQYEVEEEPTPETPSDINYETDENSYPSASKYALNKDQDHGQASKYDLNHQATSSAHGGLQGSYVGYIPSMAMHLVYLPQIDASSSSNTVAYADQYQEKVPAIVYQPVVQHPGYVQVETQGENNIDDSKQTLQESQTLSMHAGYLPVPAQESRTIAYPQPKYVIAYQQPQVTYEDKDSQPEQYVNYAGQPQQYVLTNAISHEQAYPHSEDVAPSTPYKTPSPHYVQSHVTTLVPPAVAFHNYATGNAVETPKVLSEYARGISKPIYSHISGKLVQNKYKQQYDQGDSNNQGIKYVNGHSAPSYANYYRKPASLLDSYIPSSLQIEYLKRGLSKEPLATYDLISSQRGYRFEKGFYPNQMYSTGNGGVAFSHFKRAAKKE